MATTKDLANINNDSVGVLLRSAREKLGLSIREVASSLNLMVSHIRGIEGDRFATLTNDKQFLRHVHDYAALVELDADQVVEMYRAQSAAAAASIAPRRGGGRASRYDGKWFAVAGLAIACLGLGIWAIRQTMPGQSFSAQTAQQQRIRESAAVNDGKVEIAAASRSAEASENQAPDTEQTPPVDTAEGKREKAEPSKKNKTAKPETLARSEQVALESDQAPPTTRAETAPAAQSAAQNNALSTIGAKPLRKTLVELKVSSEG